MRQRCKVGESLSNIFNDIMLTRKLCCRKDDHAMRPIGLYGCPEFSGLPDYAHCYYSQHFSWPFVPIKPVNVPTKFEVRKYYYLRNG